MASATVFSESVDGSLECSNATYATARSGGGSFGTFTTNGLAGQVFGGGVYYCEEAFLSFDLASAGVSGTINSATLSLWLTNDLSTSSDFTIQARIQDWGASLTTADWVPGADLSGKTLVAELTTAGISTGAYSVITASGSALVDAITAALAGDGKLYLVVSSDRLAAGTAPSGNEYIIFSLSESTDQDPKLVIDYTPQLKARSLLTLGCGA